MAFGWSAGDILAAIKFIIDVAQALDDVNGSQKEFRQASSFLRNLDKALVPLRTFTALEARPEYKADIESEVQAIRVPIEGFMKDVEGMAKRLGEGSASSGNGSKRFKFLRNVGSKLEWHYSTSKKAMALQKEIESHLRIIDMLMQRLTVDMLHTLQKDMKGDIQESVSTAFNTHLSPFKSSIVAEISQHDNLSRSAWMEQLEEIFERYLGSQRLRLTPSPSPSLPPQYSPTDIKTHEAYPGLDIYTPEMMKANAAHIEKLLISTTKDLLYPKIGGITADLEITHRLRLWWMSSSSNLLWIHIPSTDTGTTTSPLAIDVVVSAREANIPILWYVCKRVDSSGNEISKNNLLLDLLYSLIWQSIQNITIPFSSALDFSVTRFENVDKIPSSVPECLPLLQDLLRIKGTPLRNLAVIDGLQLLDYSDDSGIKYMIEELLHSLQGEGDSSSEPVFKTLLTTEDQTLLLLNAITPEKVLDASNLAGGSGYFDFSEFEDNVKEKRCT